MSALLTDNDPTYRDAIHPAHRGAGFKRERTHATSAPIPSNDDWARGYNKITHGAYLEENPLTPLQRQHRLEQLCKTWGTALAAIALLMALFSVVRAVEGDSAQEKPASSFAGKDHN